MPSFTAMWAMLGLFAAIAWVLTTWIRAKHGYPLDDGAGGQVHRAGAAADGAKQVEAALAERDAAFAKLEERVRVLERIATDGSARLGAEIESLREPPKRRAQS